MKAFKRCFAKRKKKQRPASSEGESQSQQPESKSAPPKPVENNTNGGGKTKEGNANVQSGLETAVEAIQIKSDPRGKNQKNNPDSIEPSGKRGRALKEKRQSSKNFDSSAATATVGRFDDTKYRTQGHEKIVNTNGSSSQLNEVVFPESSAEDRHSTISRAYDSIPLLEQIKLPRGGISVETEAVGRVQVRGIGWMSVSLIICLLFVNSGFFRKSQFSK